MELAVFSQDLLLCCFYVMYMFLYSVKSSSELVLYI